MLRVWFNHWFSTAYNIAELMREYGDIYIIGSNRNINAVMSGACDEWYSEPDICGEEYIAFCLDFCKKNGVDVFVPRRQMTYISRSMKSFEDIGVKVMAESFDVISLLEDKRAAYELFSHSEKINVPEYAVVNDRQSFLSAYEDMKRRCSQLCVKFIQDEGALSFRKITPERRFDPRMYVKADVTPEELCGYFDGRDKSPDMMLMPYLSGTEISVDCLDTSFGLIAVPRYKTSGRHEYIKYDRGILSAANEAVKTAGLGMPCNIQFRMLDGKPYLLEVNTRMSGGIQMSCLAAGINIPMLALAKLMGEERKWSINRIERTVSYIERPCIIEDRKEK